MSIPKKKWPVLWLYVHNKEVNLGIQDYLNEKLRKKNN
jgi:hypothetical protein